MIGRVLAHVGLVLVGLLVGVVGAFVQAVRFVWLTPWGAVVVPWGAALAVLVVVLTTRGAAWAVGSRRGGWLLLGGWLVGTLVLGTPSPSGDIALADGVRQYGYLIAGVTLGAAAATFPMLGATSLTIDSEPDRVPTTAKE